MKARLFDITLVSVISSALGAFQRLTQTPPEVYSRFP